MTQPNDGGCAFPQSTTPLGNTVHDEHGQGGMSLRDWFAGMAMQGLIHDILIDQHGKNVLMKAGVDADELPAFLSLLSYQSANAMLAERSKPHDDAPRA